MAAALPLLSTAGRRSWGRPHMSFRRMPLMMSLFCSLSGCAFGVHALVKSDKRTVAVLHNLDLGDVSMRHKCLVQILLCDARLHIACRRGSQP